MAKKYHCEPGILNLIPIENSTDLLLHRIYLLEQVQFENPLLVTNSGKKNFIEQQSTCLMLQEWAENFNLQNLFPMYCSRFLKNMLTHMFITNIKSSLPCTFTVRSTTPTHPRLNV